MDFFSLAHQTQQAGKDDDQAGATDLFAKAVNDRYNNAPLLIQPSPSLRRLTPMSLSLPPVPGPSRPFRVPGPQPSHHPQQPQSAPDAARFTPVTPDQLPGLLNDPHTLILDLRPLPTHLTSRLPNALPLSVPSTLLKRPLFSTAKLADMLPNRAARRKFSQWRTAHRILVHDADSHVLPDGNNILGLLRKFRTEAAGDGSAGGAKMEHQLLWLKGGFQAVWRERHDLIDFESAPDQDDEDDDSPSPPSMSSPPLPESAAGAVPIVRPSRLTLPASRPTVLRTKHLPMSAFTLSSTTSQRSGSAHHQQYLGKQAAAAREGAAPSAPNPPAPADAAAAQSSTSVAYNPFYDTIRQNLELSHGITERIPLRISQIAKARASELPFAWLRELGRWAGVDGEGTEVEDEGEGASGSGSGSGHSGSDLSGSESGEDSGSGREHGERAHVHFPVMESAPPPHAHAGEGGATEDVAEGSEALAMQFYRIELGEQRRLMGVMEHHSRESGGVMVDEGEAGARTKEGRRRKSKRAGKDGAKGSGGTRDRHAKGGFPYSITAGVEKGAKNRYRNIWPFEHARVRLQKSKPKPKADATAKEKERVRGKDGETAPLHALKLPPASQFLPPVALSLPGGTALQLPMLTPNQSSSDDYVNASYVQPLSTKKRYIATQGPLPETFNDFWTLVWEQNVHVIVMLTREVEGATIKCGNYWSGTTFGPLRLKLVEVSGAEEEQADRAVPPGSSFFPVMSKPHARPPADDTIRRVLELTHTKYPHLPPRRVVQLQYLEWPDLNVPDDPCGVLKLIREVEKEVEVSEEARGGWEGPRRPDEWRGRAVLGTVRTVTRRGSGEGSPSGTGSSGSASPTLDAVDSDSGIMKHALGERPVLLHCSAGVGRTGGFIAVDAVLDGVRREMRKRREGLRLVGGSASASTSERAGSQSGSGGDSGMMASGSRSGSNNESGSGGSSGNTSEKDASPRSEKSNAMEVDEASGGGRVGVKDAQLVMTLPAAGEKAVHVPVVSVKKDAPLHPGMGARTDSSGSSAPMDVDRKPLQSPWTGPTTKWAPGVSSASSASATSPPLLSRGSFGSSMPPSSLSPASRSLSPEGDVVVSDSSGSMSPPSALPPTSAGIHTFSFSPLGSVAAGASPPRGAVDLRTRTFSVPTANPLGAQAAASSSSAPALFLSPSRMRVTSLAPEPVSSPARSTAPSSLFSGGEAGWPTDPSSVDIRAVSVPKGAHRPAHPIAGPSVPLARMLTAKQLPAPAGSSPPQENEASPPVPGAPASQATSDPSPPAFDYTQPRRLHDDRNSPPLLSTLDEPIHRVIEDMREQRMSLCQSLRQYVFVHRAVIEGVLMMVDDERAMYGEAWMDVDPAKQEQEQEHEGEGEHRAGAKPESTGQMTIVQSESEPEGPAALAVGGKRGASPTELQKEDKRGSVLLAKRPSIKRRQRSSDEESVPGHVRAKVALATSPAGAL